VENNNINRNAELIQVIIDLCKKYPNDADLGEKVRLLIKNKL
jgi:hypothetical protein